MLLNTKVRILVGFRKDEEAKVVNYKTGAPDFKKPLSVYLECLDGKQVVYAFKDVKVLNHF